MSRGFLLLLLAVVVLLGCRYESPITREHSLPVDPAVLGAWVPVPDEGEDPIRDERMVILAYSDTEYLIHYDAPSDEMYYRAYPIEVGGVRCVQIQVIGTVTGPLEERQNARFHVAAYRLLDGVLEVKTLNTDLVDEGLKDTDSLREAFLKREEHIDLFVHPTRFKIVENTP